MISKLFAVLVCAFCLFAATEADTSRRPLVFKNWPPNKPSSGRHNMFVKLRAAGSAKVPVFSHPPQGVLMIKSPNTLRYGFPMMTKGRFSFNSAASMKPYYNAPSHSAFRITSPHYKAAFKFHQKPHYENVNVPKNFQPERFATASAIHTITAPNLSLEAANSVAEVTANDLTAQLDSDLINSVPQAFALDKPQASERPYGLEKPVREHFIDQEPIIQQHVHDSTNHPVGGNFLYQQNLEFQASPLIQPNYNLEAIAYPSTAQLQQYHAQQQQMLMNPTYLIMQSNNLLDKHKQHWSSELFRPISQLPSTQYATTFSPSSQEPVASLGQIYASQHDAAANQQENSAANQVALTQYLEPQPNNYQHSPHHFINLPEDYLSVTNDFNYYDNPEYYNQRQLENDIILKEAQENLQQLRYQQTGAAGSSHRETSGSAQNGLRIIVPDEIKRSDEGSDDEETNDGVDSAK